MEPFNALLFAIFSLMKDMTGKEDQFRGPAIRALCSITDVSILTARVLHLRGWISLHILSAMFSKRLTFGVSRWFPYRNVPTQKRSTLK